MKPFGIKAKVLKLNGASARVYLRGEVEAVSARYAAEKRNPVTLQQDQEVTEISKRNLEQKVTPEKPDNLLKTIKGYGVTTKDAGEGGYPAADDPNDPDAWR